MHTFDFIEQIRLRVAPLIGRAMRYLNHHHGTSLYWSTPGQYAEYAGYVKMDEERFEEVLSALGFERNPMAALKYLPYGSRREYEEGSWRYVPRSWDDDMDPRKQLHVRYFDGSLHPDASTGVLHLFTHYEYRWDTDPVKHYRGVEWDGPTGVAMARSMLAEAGVTVTPLTPRLFKTKILDRDGVEEDHPPGGAA